MCVPFFTNTQSLRIISLIGEDRMSTRCGTTHDTDARGVNMMHETKRHEILDPNIKTQLTLRPKKQANQQLDDRHLKRQLRGRREQTRQRLHEGERHRDAIVIQSRNPDLGFSLKLEEGRRRWPWQRLQEGHGIHICRPCQHKLQGFCHGQIPSNPKPSEQDR